jgi:hypothetical protein
MGNVFPKTILIIIYPSYGNVKMGINFVPLLHMLKTRVLGVANVRNLGLNLLKILHIEKEVFVFLILTAINVVNYLGVVLKGIHGLPKLAI